MGCKLVDVWMPARLGNFTRNRAANGGRIRKITLHHMAGNMSIEALGRLWQRPGRCGSSHYGVNRRRVGHYVHEHDIAWTDGNWQSNLTSVTIEAANSGGAPDWALHPETLDQVAVLCADIARRNGLGKLVVGQNLTWHQMYAATACPGPFVKRSLQAIANRANAINAAPTPKPPTPSGDAKYFVQVGAFAEKVNADNYAKTVQEKGFNTVVKKQDGLYRVQVGAFANKANADNRVKAIKAKGFNAIITESKGATPTHQAARYSVGQRVRVSSAYRNATDPSSKHIPANRLTYTSGRIARIERNANGTLKRNHYAIASPVDGKTIIYFVNDGDIRSTY